MTKIKYDFIVTDIDVLQQFAPDAVIVEKKAVRGKITGILNAGVTVPGIRLLTPQEREELEAKGEMAVDDNDTDEKEDPKPRNKAALEEAEKAFTGPRARS